MTKTVADLRDPTKVILLVTKTPVVLEVDRSKIPEELHTWGFVDLDLWRRPFRLFTSTAEYKTQIGSKFQDNSLLSGEDNYSTNSAKDASYGGAMDRLRVLEEWCTDSAPIGGQIRGRRWIQRSL
jgi:hypothetical protein